jgi:hypothetical protein
MNPSPANKMRSAKERRSSLIQKGIIKETINNLAVLAEATLAI